MLMDKKMIAIDDDTLTAGLVDGVLDLFGTDIAYGGKDQPRKDTGRGTGSPVLLHTTIRPDTGDGGNVTGSVVITLSWDNATDPATVIGSWTFDADYWEENQSIHPVFALPYDVPGRYLKVAVDASALVNLGTNPRCSSWVFPQ